MVVRIDQKYHFILKRLRVRDQSTTNKCFSVLTEDDISCPLPPKSGFGLSVWDGLSGECRAKLTLKRCNQLAAFAIQPIG